MSGSHSKFPPSSAHEWLYCPGWVSMHAGLTETETDESAEGTAAHALAAELLTGSARGVPIVSRVGQMINSMLITQEMQDAVDVYVKHCANLMRTHAIFAGPHMGIESCIKMPSIHAEAFGTCDFWLYTGSTLHVVDYKHGHGSVDAWENWQLIMYTCGILDQLEVNGIQDQAISVVLTIIQPRCFTKPEIDTWRVKASDLRGYFNRLHAAANTQGEPVSGEHCRYCKARLRCSAAIERVIGLMWISETVDRIGISPVALGQFYDLLLQAKEAVKSMLDAVEPEITARLTKGEQIPGWALQPTTGSLKWIFDNETILALTDMLGVDIRKPAELLTPTQAIKAGIDKNIITQYAQRPDTGLKLVSGKGSARKLGFK